MSKATLTIGLAMAGAASVGMVMFTSAMADHVTSQLNPTEQVGVMLIAHDHEENREINIKRFRTMRDCWNATPQNKPFHGLSFACATTWKEGGE